MNLLILVVDEDLNGSSVIAFGFDRSEGGCGFMTMAHHRKLVGIVQDEVCDGKGQKRERRAQ